jgi:2-hydroxychromene-2-carboxylate isomerase
MTADATNDLPPTPTHSTIEVERPASIEFFFDLMCPWAYQGAVWIREVRARTGLDIGWRFFSLEEINRVEGKKHPWERDWSYGWGQMRVAALLRRRGQADVDRWYEIMGRAFHVDGIRTHDQDIHRALLEEHGFGAATLDEALADPTTSDEVRADHDFIVRENGGFGVPILLFPDGRSIFGPVVVPAPVGDEAERLWDATLAWNEFPHVYEMRHPKTRDDLMLIATTFEPYLTARAWNTIENPAP